MIAQNKFYRKLSDQLPFNYGRLYGVVAQLEEHLPCTQGVVGSSPIDSTTL